MAQDERRYQAYYKQAQGYENLKDYRKAISAYRQAQANATTEAGKSIDKKIESLDEWLRMQQLVKTGLTSEIDQRINQLTSLSNRKRFREELKKLQLRDDAPTASYQQLMHQVELEGNNLEVAGPPINPTIRRPAPTRRSSAKPITPPPRKAVVSMPAAVPKSSPDFRTTKSAGALPIGSGNPHQ
ncbi:tetratricopeptide repeat protein [Spirosoma spitsbergense]|uniref:tetratricopeptide repeat protein n=1 Tax=Spirosoma spitsbergense TaxID=431554 RepID=UPI000377006E|nr:tetratricopeptide repeat protein [Spirosoma spitsbergense]